MLFSSLAELGRNGAASYTKAIVDSVYEVKRRFGGSIVPVPFLPLPLAGLIRDAWVVLRWLQGVAGYAAPAYVELYSKLLEESDSGRQKKDSDPVRYQLPNTLDSKYKETYLFDGSFKLLGEIDPMHPEGEKAIIRCLVGEIKKNMS